MLTEYWTENNTLANNYIMHVFYAVATLNHPDCHKEKEQMVFIDRLLPHANQFLIQNQLDPAKYLKHLEGSSIHKFDHKNTGTQELDFIMEMDDKWSN